ncbi:Molybdopterin molybdenumtransferase [Planctomycetes bacterium Pan216]|uniref:Molybdopterin molybdenumtransferase n=1 Tax=Kolteria novifilia TaxID=2527975 RepID=A0A518B553_9BACT|nr:Molybdopterin molybdenumtransferase [Planctomycetes bacterium Pan216]
MKGFGRLTAVAELIQLLDQSTYPLRTESVPLERAVGRRLASPVIAQANVPGFRRAAMDGFAVRSQDIALAGTAGDAVLHIVDESFPNRPATRPLQAGQAIRIMTGAPVPDSADTVVMVEMTCQENDEVHILEAPPLGKNVSGIGEDVAAGSTILEPPRTLRPQDVAVAAAAGLGSLAVYCQPRVAMLVTGNELVNAGQFPSAFQIVDTNSIILRTLVERDGGIVLASEQGSPRILPDDPEVLREALRTCDADCLFVSGGTSVGKEDHAPRLLAELGDLIVHGIAMKPARPMGYGKIDGRPVFLMPGNPVACLAAYDLIARRTVRHLQGMPTHLPYPTSRRRLAQPIASQVGRFDYVRAKLNEAGEVYPLLMGGASILSSTAKADGFLLVPADVESLAEGCEVVFHHYDAQEEPNTIEDIPI